MFPFKKQPEAPKFVSCETCKHLVRREDAQRISKTIDSIAFLLGNYSELELYYCPEHTKPYDLRMIFDGKSFYKKLIPAVPEHWVEVTENGKPIKKAK